jgi:hypothetical protein
MRRGAFLCRNVVSRVAVGSVRPARAGLGDPSPAQHPPLSGALSLPRRGTQLFCGATMIEGWLLLAVVVVLIGVLLLVGFISNVQRSHDEKRRARGIEPDKMIK